MYTFDSRVRYSETGEDGKLGLVGIINYMQDCSTFHSEDSGVGIEKLTKAHRAWLVSSWHIVIDERPCLGDRLVMGTWHSGVKGFYGYRNFVIQNPNGKSYVRATAVWFYYDTEKGTPVRVPQEAITPYGAVEEPLDLGNVPRKIAIPQESVQAEPVTVQRHHLDTNHHVNNAQYVEIAREALPEGLEICEIRVDYKKAAVLGDTMHPKVSEVEKRVYTVVLAGEEDTVYAVVWLRAKEEET